MKRILVPVDFSEDSVTAIDLAVEIANLMQASLRIMHVRTGKRYFPEFAKNNPDLLLADLDITYMNFLLKRASENYNVPNKEIDYKIREGNVVREIRNQAFYDDTSMIIVGTHGVSGFEDRWVGSNSYRLVAHAPCPVLTIHKKSIIQEEPKILLLIDHSRITRRIVPMVAGFAKIIGAKILLVGVNENNRWFIPGRLNMFVSQVERYLRKDQKIVYESVMLDKIISTPEKILEYAKENNVTFITLPVKKSINPFESFFNPHANELLNISDLPVLVVPDKNYF